MNLIKRSISFVFILISIFSFLYIPSITFAATDSEGALDIFPVVRCGRTEPPHNHECGFIDVLNLVDRLMNIFFYFSIIMTVILLMYGGFKYMTAGSNPGSLKEIKELFLTISIGFLIVLGAYLAIDTTVELLLDKEVIKNPLREGFPQ